MKKDKQSLIEDIKKEAERKIAAIETEFSIRDKFPDSDFKFVASSNIAYFDIKSRNEIRKILERLPPVNETTTLKVSGKEQVIDSPYRIDLKNPAVVNLVSQHEMYISYKTEHFGVTIVVPISMCMDYVIEYQRQITDSEYHYFIGVTHQQLRKKKVTAYTFENANIITWYGGTHTQCDPTYIKNIILNETLGNS